MTDTVSCSDFDTVQDMFVEGFFFRGWDCAMTGGDATVQLMMASLVFGGVWLALFVTTGSLVIPIVLALLIGGVVIVLLPATFASFALIVLLLLLAGLGTLITFRSGT